MAKCLVTGGAGFIGSHLSEALLEVGHAVAVLDDLSTGRRENLPEAASFHQVDIADRDAVGDAFARERPDVVFHYAAQASVIRSLADPAADARSNIVGGLTVLEAAIKCGVKRFVFASTGGAIYGDPDGLPADESEPARPLSPYGAAKLSFEHYLAMYSRITGVSHVCLRYANVYGPRQDPHGEAGVIAIFIGRLLRNEQPIVFGDGTQTRDYLYVSDAVSAALRALKYPESGTYNVGTGRESSVLDLVSSLSSVVNDEIEPIFAPARTGEVQRIALDASRAGADLGWSPTVGVAAGLERTWLWQKEHGGS